MYSSRGSNAYGQQSYTGQSSYGQSLGTAYSGTSVGGTDGGTQLSLPSRHSSMLGASQEADASGYRTHPSAPTHYGGQYSSVYGSASALSSAPQVPSVSAKVGASTLEGRTGYASVISDSPKFSSGDYVSSSSHSYGHKGDQIYAEKVSDYPVIDRRQYGERQSTYIGRDLQSEPTGRYADSIGFVSQHQSEIYDRIDQAVLLRQEQLLKTQALQSASLDGSNRQADYLAARGATSRHPTQDLISFGGRMDADPRSLSMLSASSYSAQHAPSILGAAPRRNVDDLMYAQSSSNPGYGVSLPPGRDYATGKGLRGPSLESDYPSSAMPRSGHPRIDERKDDRASYLREFELREEERRWERLREREREREREKEREREREREHERERERERERIDRREKERERERKRALEIRRERTPPRVSKDRRGASLSKEGRPLRRGSPHIEALHRRHSPVKEKRREYVCKVYSSSLVDVERDYFSIDKRYPRLFISPEFSKAVVNWPKASLNLPFCTPVSFEHDFIEEEVAADPKKILTDVLAEEPAKSRHGNVVWNAKIILMSGISRNAMEELSSEKSYDDRIPHIGNILRFAVLKRDHSFMAIGGPWHSADGGDPSIDDTSLIRTVQRYAKDVTQLDLQNCQRWNRFLEIHYDRVGEDGLFSHKEVTVLFVPDLSECLPSLDAWREQWLSHKKAVAERDLQLSLRKERSREKEMSKDKESESSKDAKKLDKEERKKEPASLGKANNSGKKEKDENVLKGDAAEGKDGANDKKPLSKDATETGVESGNVVKKESAGAQTSGGGKTGKKKIIKKIVKQKVVGKPTGDNTNKQQNENANVQKDANSEVPGQQDESLSNSPGVKTFVRKKVAKKVGKANESEDKDAQLEVKVEKETDCSEDKAKESADPSSGAIVQDTGVKTTVKRKIIKRVPKRKVSGTEPANGDSNIKKDGESNGTNVVQVGDGAESTKNETADTENAGSEVKKTEKKTISNLKSTKQKVNVSDTGIKNEKVEKKDIKGTGERSGSGTKGEIEIEKQKVPEKDNHKRRWGKSKDSDKSKDERDKKDGNDESRSKSNKELKEKRKSEELPRHPGFILRTKLGKDSKLRSSSLSLDSLLDYSDKDIDESTFELSLFAETLYEMLQYQMGCRLLTFLQKLRLKFVKKRLQRKRQREENNETGNEKMPPMKRAKTDELPVKSQFNQSSEAVTATTVTTTQPDNEKSVVEEHNPVDNVDEVKMQHENEDPDEDPDEDPEEDPEEDEEMEDGSPSHDPSLENNEGKTNVAEPGNENDGHNESVKEQPKDGPNESVKEQPNVKPAETTGTCDFNTCEKKEMNVEVGKKESPGAKDAVPDKELFLAFRFFDRNQVGYIRVEDMRSIIHNLGKFLSYRDVKELALSALLESNTGRDDRILYNKLVRMSDI